MGNGKHVVGMISVTVNLDLMPGTSRLVASVGYFKYLNTPLQISGTYAHVSSKGQTPGSQPFKDKS